MRQAIHTTAFLLILHHACRSGLFAEDGPSKAAPGGPFVPAGKDAGVVALAYDKGTPSLLRPAAGLAGPAEKSPASAQDGQGAAMGGSPAALENRSSRQATATTLPWVGTVEWDVPNGYGADVFEGSDGKFETWTLFAEELDRSSLLRSPPGYAGVEALPLFAVLAPEPSDFERKLKKLVRSKMYREIRTRLKREWRSAYRQHPSMTYAEYEQRLFQINNIGKSMQERDDFSMESTANEVKQTFLGKRRVDGESDIPLLAWGPFALTDTGSLKFDLGTAAHIEAETESLAVGERKKKPLLATKEYRIDTSFNLDVDPFVASARGDARAALRRCGVSFEIDWLSKVLGRELVSTEVELETDLYGDFKGFFNIVIKSR